MNWLLTLLIVTSSTVSAQSSKINALYKSLNPNSISQHLAFYELYSGTPEGKAALKRAWSLFGNDNNDNSSLLDTKQFVNIPSAIIALVNRSSFAPTAHLSDGELQIIERLSATLPNKKLKGHSAISEEEVLKLPSEEVDLARGLLLSQIEEGADKADQIKQYEATLDLMALQILASLRDKGGLRASQEDKISVMNEFIFNELHFRFPPTSTYSPDIDKYTFLPSVLDSRRGVCLGVSILYLTLAERLGLPLEIITPPGHIYVRYINPQGEIINIETTARGANTPTEIYLGINTKTLQKRTIKEAIGLAHQNQASVYLQQEDFQKAVDSYKKARLYLCDDLLIKELLAYNLIFTGNKEEGISLLNEIKDKVYPGAITVEPTAQDFLLGKVDEEGIKAAYQHVEDDNPSIISKQERLLRVLEKYPQFRGGLQQLATTWMQLGKTGKALEALERYHEIDPNDPEVEYYLSALYFERFDYNKSWQAFKKVEALTLAQDHHPRALRFSKQALEKTCPLNCHERLYEENHRP